MTAGQPYQLLPPLAPDEYAALRDSIATFGVHEAGVGSQSHARADRLGRLATFPVASATLATPAPAPDTKGPTNDQRQR